MLAKKLADAIKSSPGINKKVCIVTDTEIIDVLVGPEIRKFSEEYSPVETENASKDNCVRCGGILENGFCWQGHDNRYRLDKF